MKYIALVIATVSCISAMDYPLTQETIETEYNKPFVVNLCEDIQTNWTCIAQDSAVVLLASDNYQPVFESGITPRVVAHQALLTYVATKPTTLKFMHRQLDETGKRAVKILEEKTFNVVFRPPASKY